MRTLKCEDHYPIMGNWDVIEDGDYTTWECPKCKETHTSKHHRGTLEFVPDYIKEQYKDPSLTQPFRGGEFSAEYRDKFPEQTQKMIKSGSITKEESRNARDVWGDIK